MAQQTDREREIESGVVAYGPKDKSRMPNFSGPRNRPQKKRRKDGREREREREREWSLLAQRPNRRYQISRHLENGPQKKRRRKSARREKERQWWGSP
jgi:hypothetical protein